MNEDESSSADRQLPSIWGTLFRILTGFTGSALSAVEALGAPPLNKSAQVYRTAAVGCFFGFAALVCIASLCHVLLGLDCVLGEVFGWTGIALLHGSVFCGLRYPFVNAADEAAP